MSIYKLGKIGGSTPTPPETATIGGKEYPVVTIGSQKWLGANLDYKFSGCNFNPETWADGNPNCCYYGGGASEYKTGYGLLYNFYAFQLLETNKASLIPGWHVPNNDEWNALISTIGGDSTGGKKLKTRTGWHIEHNPYFDGNGTDNYKFSAYSSGSRDYLGGYGNGDGYGAAFWSNKILWGDEGDFFSLHWQEDYIRNYSTTFYYGMSIRLIKD